MVGQDDAPTLICYLQYPYGQFAFFDRPVHERKIVALRAIESQRTILIPGTHEA